MEPSDVLKMTVHGHRCTNVHIATENCCAQGDATPMRLSAVCEQGITHTTHPSSGAPGRRRVTTTSAQNVLQTPAMASVDFHTRFGFAAQVVACHALALIHVHTTECCASSRQGVRDYGIMFLNDRGVGLYSAVKQSERE